MNLRSIVRGAVNAVNADVQIQWLQNEGYTAPNSAGASSPIYADPQTLWAQIQPLPTDELSHMDQLNIQGVLRSVYLRGAIASAVREDGTGGDLLQFPELAGGATRNWLVMLVNEQWPDWCHVTVRLQNS